MENLKNIISTFINKSPEDISFDTIIDRTAVQGSILIHRMYAEISNTGLLIDNYSEIKTFGDLYKKINPEQLSDKAKLVNEIHSQVYDSNSSKIGIDIEKISNFPNSIDYREDQFYIQNFTKNEISYCILKQTPEESFAGIFCVKEALCKANNELRNIPFNKIEISHNKKGQPIYPHFNLSISHANDLAIAVVISTNNEKESSPKIELNEEVKNYQISDTNKKGNNNLYIVLAALIMSFIALLTAILR